MKFHIAVAPALVMLACAAPGCKPGGGAPATGGKDFDEAAAMSALGSAAGAAKGCKTDDGPTGSARVRVTFATSGIVSRADVFEPPFAGTPVGGCIAGKFRSARVPPFDGTPVTKTKTVTIN